VFSVIGTNCAFNAYSILGVSQTLPKKRDFTRIDLQIRRLLPGGFNRRERKIFKYPTEANDMPE
jgi:hypothetical protein